MDDEEFSVFREPRRHHHHIHLKREPKFISFQTKDNNIEVEIDFAIPFLTIPVKRSMNGAQSFLDGLPLANINVGAIVLAAGVALIGTLIGGFVRTFNGENSFSYDYPQPIKEGKNFRGMYISHNDLKVRRHLIRTEFSCAQDYYNNLTIFSLKQLNKFSIGYFILMVKNVRTRT